MGAAARFPSDMPERTASPRRGRWRRRLLWAPVAAWAAAIFFVSHSPAPPALPSGFTDKHGHLAAYAGLSALTLRALSGAAWAGVTPARAGGAALLSAAYGISDEWHQSFVPGRTADPGDLGADAAGAALAAAAGWALARRRRATE